MPQVTCSACRVPVLTQFASPELVGPIVEGGADPATDPAWADSGATSRAEYARWSGHLCGMTCLRMALGTGAPSLFALRDGAVRYGAYTQDAEGLIRGLVYAPFVRYVQEVHGLDATVHRHLSSREILDLLDGGRTVLASVHHGIRRPELPPPGRGGHLVLLTSRAADGTGVHFHNPSGTTAGSRAADLPLPDFERFFAGRGVSLAAAAHVTPPPGDGAPGPGAARVRRHAPHV